MNRGYVVDLAERVVSTYVETYLGLWIASGLGVAFLTDLSSANRALVSVLPTVLALVKGLVAKKVGSPNSAALVSN